MAYKDPNDPRKNAAKRRWYLRNKEKHKADRKKRQKRNREYVKNFKKGKACLDCKNMFPFYAMDFDHKDTTQKSFNLSLVTTQSLETIDKEIKKCDLICSNCHRGRTYKRLHGLVE